MYVMTADEITEVIDSYHLPELPEADEDHYLNEDDETVSLVLFRFQQDNVPLGDGFSIADAQDYCQLP
jgi:hypothetical protein